MSKVPSIIVEGVDDIPIYDELVNNIEHDYKVFAVENLEGFNAGCDGVISAMNYIDALPRSRHDYEKFIIGIIDKDVKDFRNEIPDNKYIFPLKYYSMESHFICKDLIIDLVKYSTKTTASLRDLQLENLIFEKIMTSLNNLYYISLDALYGSLDSNYKSDISYSATVGRFKDPVLLNKIELKKTQLQEFADSKGISFNIESMKKFIKGKWLLDVFCIEFEKKLKELPLECTSGAIQSCQCCISEAEEKCLYKIKEGVNHKSIKTYLMTSTNHNEFGYVKERLLAMSSRAA
ncbi:DUF4435 domain-containing protein [Photobacterium leiognathi]|uniref:DUF4435 domain-containing protein n=1 Tax=Photobacterium leiognathi TaxID=553611 RepID=UPI0029818346|nr:DUF4435 domain-containing protein [Photobacterium leiognathi]